MWKRDKKTVLFLTGLLTLVLFFLWTAGKYRQGQPEESAVRSSDSAPQIAEALARVRTPESKGKIALTFDDGPSGTFTPQLLDGLAKRGVKATFFITGQNAEENPELVRRIREEGHLIGNHTYSHLQLNSSNREKFKEELIRTNEIIKEITGEEVVYVRPPYGSWDKTFETELNMFPVLWTIDPLDWCTNDAGCVVKKVVPKVKENSIILLHDEYASTVTAALQIVDELKKQGYEFVTVEEILFD
ncbi:MAG: polysaccharide deacetylase family protein [Lachnospiraceae bacterium]|nr:polysaccharide deacetylase family protein [Lachnospiraceae bacterium]